MELSIIPRAPKSHVLYIADNADQLTKVNDIDKDAKEYARQALAANRNLVTLSSYPHFVFVYFIKNSDTNNVVWEGCRKAGSELQLLSTKYKLKEICIINVSNLSNAAYLLAEGLVLANYQFLKYKTDRATLASTLLRVTFTKQSITELEKEQLAAVSDAVGYARDLVNEPPNVLTATRLADEIKAMCKGVGCKVTVLHKVEIEKEKMGGILAVNLGSVEPPTFTVVEYKPKTAINKNPIVLVGKGIVYDTGGLSLKPTAASMDRMKSDMSGAAVVSATTYAIARLGLPLHVITLVPSTDNRPGGNAYTPGDIITMYSGTTVEVLNTDAEGRLVLADALHWAKRYKPELVVDFATLTGAASAAIGEQGMVCMGTANESIKQQFKASGHAQYERMAEFPMWSEYADLLKSEVADLKNVGGPTGGAITAGKFLEHFTGYPWMHFDIAGVSFGMARRGYIPSGGTGFGIRMLVDFLVGYANSTQLSTTKPNTRKKTE